MIIGLTGAAGCGKDTVARHLMVDPHWVKYAMAGPLKAGLVSMFNIPIEDIENPELKNSPDYKFGKSIRFMAQTLGTEWGRNLIADDVWVLLAKENITKLKNSGKNVVITDCRFDNEADMIHELGGIIIKIERRDNPHTRHVMSGGLIAHSSEIGIWLDKVDFIVQNNWSVEMCMEEINKIIVAILLESE